jgi:hypothetical protein
MSVHTNKQYCDTGAGALIAVIIYDDNLSFRSLSQGEKKNIFFMTRFERFKRRNL